MNDSTHEKGDPTGHDMATRRTLLLGVIPVLAAVVAPRTVAATLGSTPKPPPNLVVISDRVVTSGQPSAEWLRTLRAQGFDAACTRAADGRTRAGESVIVASQGLVVTIPIVARPRSVTTSVPAVTRGLASRKVLVHCQINLRASSMMFLYRVISLRGDPERAYESVSRVWKPDGPWLRFIEAQLQRNGVTFKPY